MASPKSIWLAFLSLLLLSQLSHFHSQASYHHQHHLLKTNTTMINTKCLEMERQTLLQFKSGLSDPAHRLSSWIGDDCCAWLGVTCSNDIIRHVVKLDLRNVVILQSYYTSSSYTPCDINKALGGKLDPTLVNLQQLHFLDLSCNDFNGIQIPNFMGFFQKLEYLNLSYAGFIGTIPHHLGNLSTLKSLDLSYNYNYNYNYRNSLAIDNAGWLSGLTSLKYLNLSYVNISQAPNWLSAVNMLPSLLDIHLSDCGLHFPWLNLPYLNFTSLSVLDLSINYINSTLPNWLFNLSSLEFLYLGDNEFEGTISSNIGNMTSLKALDLSYNFPGNLQIPTTLGNLCNLHTLSLSYLNLSPKLAKLGKIFSGCIRHSLEELHLSNTSLSGSLPDWLENLTNLKFLGLSYNNINSNLPSWLYKLSRLESLYLSSNALDGPIPANIDECMSSLKILDLSYNQGLSLSTSLGNLCKLQSLYLSGLDLSKEAAKTQQIFSGCIAQSLKMLWLDETKLQGDMPYWINGLKNLKVLGLSDNQINSTLPPWLFNLTNISSLYLAYNDFHGSIPSVIENMISLEVLRLTSNSHLEGPIPMTLGNLCKLRTLGLTGINISQNFQESSGIFSGCIKNSLQFLYLGNTSLSGAIPESIGQLSNLVYLDLENNNLEGVLTQDKFSNLQNLEYLVLSGNAFTGAIDFNINGTMPQLVTLSLSMNKINGMVPFTLCTLANTRALDVSWNHLFGELPNCWNNNSQFMVLDFSSNNISGGIPNSICSVQELESLHLSNNSLSGPFPDLKECHSLVTLDLSYNNFYGSIPHWIAESMHELQILNLKSNKFSSYLPAQLSSLPKLHILDLSHNNFFGSIPRNFGDFNAMTLPGRLGGPRDLGIVVFSTEYVSLVIKGNEYKCERILSLIIFMDLSCNNLCGSIPEELTNLSGLKTLNLSENHLTGDITNKIHRMQELEALDLSRNNISGLIPLSLGSLDSLGDLNLSYNNLSGKIPFEKHLTTLDDPYIYIGNPELCGPPSSRNCSWDEVLTTSTVDGKQKDIWLHLGIGCGFVTGLWTVFIIMLFKNTWRVAYFRYVDNMWDDICVAILLKITRLKTKYRIEDHPMH